MLARIAQELYWLGRGLTRAEHTARMLDGAFHADVAGGVGVGTVSGTIAARSGVALSWSGVLAVIGAKPPAPGEGPAEGAEAAAAEAAGHAPAGLLGRREIAPLLTLDTESPASVVSCVYRARERARTLRDVVSTEMWQALNSFYLSLGRYDLEAALATGPYSVYQEVKERCALFWGLLDRTMLRDEACWFLDAGGRIEEADMVLRMLRVAIPAEPTSDEPQTAHEAEALALLQAVGGFQAFRRQLRRAPTLDRVGRFLLYDAQYPGSVRASLEELRDALESADPAPRQAPPVLRLGRLIAELEMAQRMATGTEPLVSSLRRVQNELELVDREIDERYFAVAAAAALHFEF
ncbi:alpha-E domain-containing protein [Conexibacter sp. S30A1]|uniref:alpha-E domain-containing protein n=1 Tax=Conexibacter sp. S30A1 TaxID=2937800 RepID=UPI00200C9EF3|nr:alpha-E domain-containing protein [Conexibacter sp. S30A1]